MFEKNWSIDLIPDLSGKIAVVTGANTGLGFKSALELARKNALVIIACRSEEKGKEASLEIKKQVSNAKLDVIALDLTNIESIRSFAKTFHERYKKLDILMNNAGVVNLEKLQRLENGHEMHMATNHLGHFALTALLSKALVNTPHARVVTLTSGAYKVGVINYDDIKWQKREYSRVKAYGDSKLANLLFTYELQKYFDKKNFTAQALSAHPGLTATPRQQKIGIGGKLSKYLATPVEKGVAPQLMAATYKHTKANNFYGPRFLIWGSPALQKIKEGVIIQKEAKSLWEYSLKEMGVEFY